MLKLLITILLCSSIPQGLGNDIYKHKFSADVTLKEFLSSSSAKSIGVSDKCMTAEGAFDKQCILDISRFSQENITDLLKKAKDITPSIHCVHSTLVDLDFSSLDKLGHRVTNLPIKENDPSLFVVGNLQLKNINFGEMFRRGYMYPRYFTIYNNPQLSPDSIDRIKLIVAEQVKEQENKIGHDRNPVIVEKILIQNYGECDYKKFNPGKTSLRWDEFRWCRTVSHDVTLEGEEIQSGQETANIIEVKGCLKIKNTKITNLEMLPKRIKVKPGCSEISGNKDLCVSMMDEIRLKKLGFTIENNKKLSCRGVPIESTTTKTSASTTNAPTTTEATTSNTIAPTTTEATTSTTIAPTTTESATSTTIAPTTTESATSTTIVRDNRTFAP